MGLWRTIIRRLRSAVKKRGSCRGAVLRPAGIQEAAHAVFSAVRKSESIVSGALLLSRFTRRVRREKDTGGMLRAFRDMTRLHQANGDPVSLDIAQILGEKLYSGNTPGVSKTAAGGRILFLPTEETSAAHK